MGLGYEVVNVAGGVAFTSFALSIHDRAENHRANKSIGAAQRELRRLPTRAAPATRLGLLGSEDL